MIIPRTTRRYKCAKVITQKTKRRKTLYSSFVIIVINLIAIFSSCIVATFSFTTTTTTFIKPKGFNWMMPTAAKAAGRNALLSNNNKRSSNLSFALSNLLINGYYYNPKNNKSLCSFSSFSSASFSNESDTNNLNSSTSSSSLPQQIVHSSSSNNKNKKPPKVCIAIAGGGSSSLSTLSSTPGASSILLEGILTYDRHSFTKFITSHPPPPPTATLFSSFSSSLEKEKKKKKQKGFGYASTRSSILLSNAALHHAMTLCTDINMIQSCMGIGCSSSLVSVGKEDAESKCFISLSKADGNVYSYAVTLGAAASQGNGDGENGDGEKGTRRTRSEEDEICGDLILLTLLKHSQNKPSVFSSSSSSSLLEMEEFIKDATLTILSKEHGDSIIYSQPNMNNYNDKDKDELKEEEENKNIQKSVKRILKGDADAILVVPSSNTNTSTTEKTEFEDEDDEEGKEKITMKSLVHTWLPLDPLIFPGSFNPPHIGHVKLANAAVTTMTRIRREEKEQALESVAAAETATTTTNTSYFDDDDDDYVDENNHYNTEISSAIQDLNNSVQYHYTKHHPSPSVLFEMSITNADKPSMDVEEVNRRLQLFASLANTCHDNSNNNSSNSSGTKEEKEEVSSGNSMLNDWGVLLTSAPLFSEKEKILSKYLPSNDDTSSSSSSFGWNKYTKNNNNNNNKRKMTFVIGVDTFVRIINPKYYENNYENMLNALRETGDCGVRYVVGGRLEQGQMMEGNEPKFITGAEELSTLPKDVQDLFILIREEDFRVDISSTELRKKASSAMTDE